MSLYTRAVLVRCLYCSSRWYWRRLGRSVPSHGRESAYSSKVWVCLACSASIWHRGAKTIPTFDKLQTAESAAADRPRRDDTVWLLAAAHPLSSSAVTKLNGVSGNWWPHGAWEDECSRCDREGARPGVDETSEKCVWLEMLIYNNVSVLISSSSSFCQTGCGVCELRIKIKSVSEILYLRIFSQQFFVFKRIRHSLFLRR